MLPSGGGEAYGTEAKDVTDQKLRLVRPDNPAARLDSPSAIS